MENKNVTNNLVQQRSYMVETMAMFTTLIQIYNEHMEYIDRFEDYLFFDRNDDEYYREFDEYIRCIDEGRRKFTTLAIKVFLRLRHQ
ncbi:hypothetical protein DICVIV_12099 [Dictyocaulus viviparus]|uniref:Uncharacterized protein n=1 Tax=Dictyocaulus viviparus TaxID=29172 RepID=A0A0D8XHV1_DICVI|nr:hypothetical protein DICVIV_12099 [Dictyocaulus viviparus]